MLRVSMFLCKHQKILQEFMKKGVERFHIKEQSKQRIHRRGGFISNGRYGKRY
jgi:hypothetical protein